MKTPSNLRFDKFSAFRKEHGEENFSTIELCDEYCRLKKNWWGSNLVVLPNEKNDGLWSPRFNVFN